MIAFEQRTLPSFDGTPLGVQVFGPPGAPVLLLANGLGATVNAYRFVIERFRRTFRFVSWDYRGLYSSGRPLRGYRALAVEDHARDALAVLDAVGADAGGAEEVHALGWSMGVQVLLELQRLAPERTDTLVLHNGVPGRPWATFAGGALKKLVDPMLAGAQRVDGALERAVHGVVSWSGFIPAAIRLGLVHHDLDREVFSEVAQGFKQLDMHLYVEILRKLGEHDAYDVLPRVRCPTLILQGTEDRMTPLSAARRMAAEIPAARLVMLAGGTHYAAVEMPALVNEHLEEFWRVAGLDVADVGAP